MNEIKKYFYYGLGVLSDFVFPELESGEFDFPDITLAVGKVISSFSELNTPVGLHCISESCCIFKLQPDVLIQVENGSVITVEAVFQHNQEFTAALRPYLLGPVFNALLHQREISLFHASVVHKQNWCLAVIGKSGDGKSTTAAALCRTGRFGFVADDVCAVRFKEMGQYQILPSAPRFKLLNDAVEKLGIDRRMLTENFDEDSKKSFVQKSLSQKVILDKLAAIFILWPNQKNEISAELIHGVEKAKLLLENMIWSDYLRWLGKREILFQECLSIAKQTEVYLLHFDKTRHSPEKVASIIEESLVFTDRQLPGQV